MENKKIIIFIGRNAIGGAERVACNLSQEWSKQGMEVHLITLYPPAGDAYPLDFRVQCHALFKDMTVRKTMVFLLVIPHLRRLVHRIQPDAYLSFITRYNVLSLVALLGAGVRIFVSDRDNPYLSHGVVLNVLRSLLYRFAAGIVAQTETARSVLEKQTGNKNIKAIFNPLAPEFLNFTPVNGLPDSKMIITVGRLIPGKDHASLISFFADLAPDYPDWKLVIAGNGPERSNLENLAKLRHVETQVIFLGNCKTVLLELQKAEIFAFTSRSEGFPNALAEAMSVGLACISRDCPTGPSELIQDGRNGFLIPMGENELYRKKLEMLLRNRDIRVRFAREALKIKDSLAPRILAGQYADFLLKH